MTACCAVVNRVDGLTRLMEAVYEAYGIWSLFRVEETEDPVWYRSSCIHEIFSILSIDLFSSTGSCLQSLCYSELVCFEWRGPRARFDIEAACCMKYELPSFWSFLQHMRHSCVRRATAQSSYI